jgi:Flp pilus assembly protein TadD
MPFHMRGAALGGAAALAFLTSVQMSAPAVAMGSSGGEAPSVSMPTYDPSADYAAGVAALNAGQYKEAEKSLSRVANAAPDSQELWLMLGRANAGQNDLKGAQKAYERAIKLEPDNLEAHRGLGLALAGLKDPKAQAELDWLTAKAATCGESCADAPDIKAAIDAVKAAMGGAPQAALEPGALMFAAPAAGDHAYLEAVGLINEHRYDEALRALDHARAAFGPHPDILTYQGYAWRKKGDWNRAETYYRQALAVAPAHKGALEYFGELKVERGDLKGARTLLVRLDRACAFGCPEAEELRRWIAAGRAPGA